MHETSKSSQRLTLVAIILIVVVLGNALFVYMIIERIKDDARIINYTGIIRGSIQRITKLELSGKNSDGYITDVNNIFNNLENRQKGLDIFIRSEKYLELEGRLKEQWRLLQKAFS